MLIKNKIIKDTVLLTLLQLFLDSAALILNVFITRNLGTSAMGIVALTGSFLALAGILSNGNAFLCTSRLISEELGKTNKNPNKVLRNGLLLCVILSVTVSFLLFVFSDTIGMKFFKSIEMSRAVRFMPLTLISGACASCFKGYFNAMRKVSVTAIADILEFLIRAAVIIVLTSVVGHESNASVCSIMLGGMIAGNCFSLLYFLVVFAKLHEKYTGNASISFKGYVSCAIPIMVGGIITTVLSSTNDALIPVTLRQYGNSTAEALSRFGIFEAIVIPALFFPSVILCSMSGIIVTESARASAAGNIQRIKSITIKLIECTLIYSVFAAAVLMRFGKEIGELLGGGVLGGQMISVIAPVIPFIYLEIVLEAIIKGLGLQGFSSLNYLAEYAVRISIVMIFVPKFGFYGIVASYYASNIIGNSARMIKVLTYTGVRLKIFKAILLPIIYAFLTMGTSELLARMFVGGVNSTVGMVSFTAIWCTMYIFLFIYVRKDCIQECGKSKILVQSAQTERQFVL